MVANKTPTIMEGVRNRFRRNATHLDPKWALPEFTVAKISKASAHWSRKCIGATRNADKLRRKHLTAQREAMIDKVIPEEQGLAEEFQKALAKIENKEEIKQINKC